MKALPPSCRIFVYTVITCGSIVLAVSLYSVIAQPLSPAWLVFAFLTLLAGSFTVKIPGIHSRIALSDSFALASVLLFGPAAGTVTVALEGFIISFWFTHTKEPYRAVFNVASLALSMGISSRVFFALLGRPPLIQDPQPFLVIILPLAVLAVLHYVLNTGLVATVIALERTLKPFVVWRQNFAWVSLMHLCDSLVAAFLALNVRDFTFNSIGVVVLLLVMTYATFRNYIAKVEASNEHLRQVNRLHLSTIETLAMAIDAKDQITHGHIRRVQIYARGLAEALHIAEESLLRGIEAAALLHDMGKLAIPEYILNKPGRLTPAEFEKIKIHATVGADILSAIDFPYPVIPFIRHHHENWDGTGYPDGLAGLDIPLGARLLAVVDCFDAITSDRPYRARQEDAVALKIIHERAGTMYDPAIVHVFASILPSLQSRVRTFSDPPAETLALRAITHGIETTAMADTEGRDAGLRLISESRREALALFELAQAVGSALDLQDTLLVLGSKIQVLLPFTTCAIFVRHREVDLLQPRFVTGDHREAFTGMNIQFGQRLTGWVAAHRRIIRNADPTLEFGTKTVPLTSSLVVPIADPDRLLGVLSLYHATPDFYTPEHERLAEVVARQVAVAMRNALKFEQLRKNSLTDSLTGLPNIQYLQAYLETELRWADHHGHSVSLLLLDLDDLRNINRRHGRATGDAVLKELASFLRSRMRNSDLLFRFAGDEFIAVLVDTDRAAAGAIAERMSVEISTRSWPSELGTVSGLRITSAIVTFPSDGASIDGLLVRLDEELQLSRAASGSGDHYLRES